MARFPLLLAALTSLLMAALATAAEPTLLSASGTVVKANPNVVILRPRGSDGQFAKAVALKLRGTSKVSLLGTQTRDGQVVPVQREIDPKDLQPNQGIAVIFANIQGEYILLYAVAQPLSGR